MTSRAILLRYNRITSIGALVMAAALIVSAILSFGSRTVAHDFSDAAWQARYVLVGLAALGALIAGIVVLMLQLRKLQQGTFDTHAALIKGVGWLVVLQGAQQLLQSIHILPQVAAAFAPDEATRVSLYIVFYGFALAGSLVGLVYLLVAAIDHTGAPARSSSSHTLPRVWICGVAGGAVLAAAILAMHHLPYGVTIISLAFGLLLIIKSACMYWLRLNRG